MARVFLTEVASTGDQLPWLDALLILQDAARSDRFGHHSVCDSPESADVILCSNKRAANYFDVLSHPAYSPHVEKFFLYNHCDFGLPLIPGIYPSIERRDHDPRRTRSGPYLEVIRRDDISYTPLDRDPRHLFSFAGSVDTAAVRKRLANLTHPAYCFLDTSASPGRWAGQPDDVYRGYKEQYAEILRESRFVLCPRGIGASSLRLFEAMKTGRVPVVISDQWVEPAGPNWGEFCVRVRECDVERIPSLLESLQGQAIEMGELARKAWCTWFERDVVFHHFVEACLALRAARRFPERVSKWLVRRKMFTRRYFRSSVLRPLKAYLRGGCHA
jgi:hypothetical protein